ncbi:MAG: iron-sulfur cluster assembly scaffold protein [Desulfobacterales bacterium]|nr:MAG: iron-sulfur cluster assembly scaffold protein [Desulfobacterales bacterium]
MEPESKTQFSGEPINLWQDHSLQFLEMAFRTDKQCRLASPDGYGRNTGICGDTVEIFLRVADGRIKEVVYDIDGCMNTNAAANTIAFLGEGKPLPEAWHITAEMVASYLQTLPEDHFHCAELVAGAFYQALKSIKDDGSEPPA